MDRQIAGAGFRESDEVSGARLQGRGGVRLECVLAGSERADEVEVYELGVGPVGVGAGVDGECGRGGASDSVDIHDDLLEAVSGGVGSGGELLVVFSEVAALRVDGLGVDGVEGGDDGLGGGLAG